ncbi:hypothetical protein KP509_16G019500 [Ceratopteris richardii]|uniref:CDAN1-interacting nuclease 1 n=1 Tax=Ceratopteris richardii TaxID=49495 RepID=A0A8T2T2N9_CERRI|nr:hypothetical protein KP509_16G019500 [Ceratopteris richardii]
MKAREYEEVCAFFENSNGGEAEASMEAVRSRFPHISVDTLLAIDSQLHTRRLRLSHHKLRQPHLVQQYISRYVEGEDILKISSVYEINPCLLARIILEHLFGLTKHQITECLKDPGCLPEDIVKQVSEGICISSSSQSSELVSAGDMNISLQTRTCHISWERLHDDLYKCMDNDNATSPYIELIRRVTGIEYEAHLYRQLKELGISFQTENDLREAGFSKTPDVKLDVPIAVKGRVVNWIDSKASFGDEFNHKNQAELQFQRYVNRFGPGMVIYWFGFVEELDIHPDVLLLDDFPSKQDIYCLPSLCIEPIQYLKSKLDD